MTPLAPHRPSRPAGRARFGALALSLALHGAAAAAILYGVDQALPAPGGAISVELVASVPGGSAGAHSAADTPAAKPEPAPTAQPEKAEAIPKVEPAPEPTEAPVVPAKDEPTETKPLPKPAPAPEATRALEQAARPKLALKPAPKPAQRAAPARQSEPDRMRDSGTAGPAGSAADTPQTAALERTAPGFAVGSGANPLPDYPYRARRLGHEGRVVLKVAVGANGVPASVTVEHSSGHDTLDDAALDTVRRWHFTPATLAGVAVAGTVEVPITFRLVTAKPH
ncbi:MAG: TonB family protein [Candidatus Eiseniibacteriota bacterium]